MSIRSLKAFNVQLCRHAYVLASKQVRILSYPMLMPAQDSQKREAHNNLFQMSGYASKPSYNAEILKAPNCLGVTKSGLAAKAGGDSDYCRRPLPQDRSPERPMVPIGQGGYSGCRPPKGQDPSEKSLTSETSRDGASKGSSGPYGDGGKDSMDNYWKILAAVLAALGLGGLAWWLLRRRPTSQVSESGPTLLRSSDLPKHVPYLLIGGGTAAFSAFRAIKANDAKAKVLMITDEYRKPYMRPPLSKELWYSAGPSEVTKDYRFKQWTGTERSLFFEPEEFFISPTKLMDNPNGGIAVAHGFTVKKVDPSSKKVILTDGYEIFYDECLIATGCSPKNLPIFLDAPSPIKEKVMLYRTPDDFEKLKRYVDAKKNVTIIGNGFIGSELACSLANYRKSAGSRIFQIFPESGNMSKVLPDYLSKWTMQKVESQGVCVLPNASVVDIKRDNCSLKLILSTGDTIITDVVCVCVGCEANINIAKSSGLEVDRMLGGFVVNAELEARRNLFVAGDASCFYDPLLGRRRVEHHDHSIVSGRLAGENMVGKKNAYIHQSMFWSDLGPEIGYEGIGLVDSSLPTVGVFALPNKVDRRTDNLTESREKEVEKPLNEKDLPDVKCDIDNADNYGRGVIFYLKEDKIVGILLWNLFNRIGLARTIINQNRIYDDLNEVAKLFEIHS
ncbi:putative apoptosis-inducing factor 1, mitochondrial isoform X3 [Glossina fuscipes]|uniref:Apoptosis-inducing factor 1, mitochondrial isoform X3 n=1 Tax=Glossina fuscipes TaxID=7396 RepID=A0A8U0WFY4_9MUSC|nr:putative apoptosis-inducing factor 1, mitochondrial isoform X3 [Glossina fuscipes]